ncbi:hypothetical protein Tco_0231072 [Tanacetum coccineum]
MHFNVLQQKPVCCLFLRAAHKFPYGENFSSQIMAFTLIKYLSYLTTKAAKPLAHLVQSVQHSRVTRQIECQIHFIKEQSRFKYLVRHSVRDVDSRWTGGSGK